MHSMFERAWLWTCLPAVLRILPLSLVMKTLAPRYSLLGQVFELFSKSLYLYIHQCKCALKHPYSNLCAQYNQHLWQDSKMLSLKFNWVLYILNSHVQLCQRLRILHIYSIKFVFFFQNSSSNEINWTKRIFVKVGFEPRILWSLSN